MILAGFIWLILLWLAAMPLGAQVLSQAPAAPPPMQAPPQSPVATTEALETPHRQSLGSWEVDLHAFVALPLATALGAALALRPRRRGTPQRSSQVVQTQIILSIIGALVMIVVGTSLARAFGVVGAAGLVRYRAKIDDPKDAGVMLTTLAVGLACGIGVYGLAVVATVFLMGVLWVIESFEPSARKEFILEIKVEGCHEAPADGGSAAAPPPREIRASRIETRRVFIPRAAADGDEDRRHLRRDYRARSRSRHGRRVEGGRQEEGRVRSACS